MESTHIFPSKSQKKYFTLDGVFAKNNSHQVSRENELITAGTSNIDSSHEHGNAAAIHSFDAAKFDGKILDDIEKEDTIRNVSRKMIVAAVANASTAYNLTVIGYVLLIMREVYPRSDSQITSIIASCSLVGAITGQIVLGYIGDYHGRRTGMILTILLTICGALASAILPTSEETSAYAILAACRFVLGIGVGGVYPLSATTAAESGSNHVQNARRVIIAFSLQGWGQFMAPIMTIIIISLCNDYALDWRLILAVGAIPGILVLREAILSTESSAYLESSQECSLSLFQVIKTREHRDKLIGTAFGWFLFDITFYGNVIFTPIVLEDVFEIDQADLFSVAQYSALVTAFALPGYYVSVWLIPYMGHRLIQIQGFIMMCILFIILGFGYEYLAEFKSALFILYSLTFFFSNFGPNSTTFSLPATIFPPEMRGKMGGISAACGKIGATFGAGIFTYIEANYGLPVVLICCGIISFIGAIVTYVFVHPPPIARHGWKEVPSGIREEERIS